MVPGKYLIITATTGNVNVLKEWAHETKENKQKGREVYLPEAFLCSRLPLQRDGIRNDICDGKFPHFEGRRQNRTLKNNKRWSIKS